MSTLGEQWPFHSEDEIEAVTKVLSSGRTNYWTGNECRQFENEFAAFLGVKYAVALMNGTVALEAALLALNIGPGDEVITSCRTFIASASAVVMRGALPITADVDADSQNITPETILPCITPRTKAIIVVHLAGWPADMPGILKLAREHHLAVIEDCAQAHGARINGRYVGAWGDIAAFSFCQDKIMTTGGEGGIITTNDEDLWKKIWSFKDHGKNYDKVSEKSQTTGFRWLHDSFGTNWRMTEMQSVIGRIQLKKLPGWLQMRRQRAQILVEALGSLPAVRIPVPDKPIEHAFYKFYLFLRPEVLRPGWDRDRILQEAVHQGVRCFSGSCSEIYLEKAFETYGLRPAHRRTTAEILGKTSLMFQVDPSVDEKKLYETAEIMRDIIQAASQ